MTNDQLYNNLFASQRMVGAGIYDGLSAVIAESCGFDFIWVSSFSLSVSNGHADIGLITPDEMYAKIKSIRNVCNLPIVVDMDSGYGNNNLIEKVVREFTNLGVSAVSIEDNPINKKSSLYTGYERHLASAEEHSERIASAHAGSLSAGGTCSIIARTEALVANMGVDEALKRSHEYVRHGASAVFAQTKDTTGNELINYITEWSCKTPVFIAPTLLPQVPHETLMDLGGTHVIYANQAVRAVHKSIEETFKTLIATGVANSVKDSISTLQDVSSIVGEKAC